MERKGQTNVLEDKSVKVAKNLTRQNEAGVENRANGRKGKSLAEIEAAIESEYSRTARLAPGYSAERGPLLGERSRRSSSSGAAAVGARAVRGQL